MRYRHHLLIMLKNLVSPKLPLSTKQTDSTFIVGNVDMMVLSIPSVTSHADLTIIITSICQKKSKLFWICVSAILTPVLSYSGANLCSVGIHALLPSIQYLFAFTTKEMQDFQKLIF